MRITTTLKNLHTPHCVLNPLQPEHAEALHAHWTEPEVLRYLWDGRTVSLDAVREIIARGDELFRIHGAGLWGVFPADSVGLIGCAGFWYFHEPPELELVLSLSPASWGRGLARECAEGLVGYAFDTLRWPVVQASADAPNEASIQLMGRLGMRHSGQRPGEFGSIEVFRISVEEWRSRTSN